jgi:hypothetical protein
MVHPGGDDEENLEKLKESYPVSHKTHTEILEALLTYRRGARSCDGTFCRTAGATLGISPVGRVYLIVCR